MKKLPKMTFVFRVCSCDFVTGSLTRRGSIHKVKRTHTKKCVSKSLAKHCLLLTAYRSYLDRPVADCEGQHCTPIARPSPHRTGPDTISFEGLEAGKGIFDLARSQHISLYFTIESRYQVNREFTARQFYFGPQTMP